MVTGEDWWESAACLTEPLKTFFPGPGGKHKYDLPRMICAGCPVVDECFDDIMGWETRMGNIRGIRHGMYAGLTPDERHELRSTPWTT